MSDVVKVNYVELCVGDAARAKAFYGAAFGWAFTDYGPEYVAFNDGKESGGLRVGGSPRTPLVIMYADDLEAVKKRVVEAGGTIVGPDHVFPGGRRFHCRDPFGNEVGVWRRE